MGVKRDNSLTHPHLIVCEGLDAKLFLMYYLQSVIIHDNRFEEFKIMEPGGNEDIKKFIKLLPKLPGFLAVKSVTVIRDSERNSQGASQSIQTLFMNNRFAVPNRPCEVAYPKGSEHSVKVGYALFPEFNSESTDGTLEDLCMKTLNHPDKDSILCIVDHALETYEEQIGILRRLHKNRLHTFLSLTDRFVGKRIGESAQANAFDYTSGDFELLTIMLAQMLV